MTAAYAKRRPLVRSHAGRSFPFLHPLVRRQETCTKKNTIAYQEEPLGTASSSCRQSNGGFPHGEQHAEPPILLVCWEFGCGLSQWRWRLLQLERIHLELKACPRQLQCEIFGC